MDPATALRVLEAHHPLGNHWRVFSWTVVEQGPGETDAYYALNGAGRNRDPPGLPAHLVEGSWIGDTRAVDARDGGLSGQDMIDVSCRFGPGLDIWSVLS